MIEMELAGLPGKERAQSLLQPSRFDSMKVNYQSVCDAQRRATQRNTALLADLSSLRRRLQLAKETASIHITRFTSLKCHYEAYVASAHTEWVKLTTQQPSMPSRCHDDRQPDSLMNGVSNLPHPLTSSHAPIPPPSAPIASSTLLEPRQLSCTLHETTGSEQSTVQTTKQTLLSQQIKASPKPPTSLVQLGASNHTEGIPGTLHGQDEGVKLKNGDLKQASIGKPTVAIGERSSTMDEDSDRQSPALDKETSKTVSLSTSKEKLGENDMLTGGDRSEIGVELPCQHSTDPEQLLEELSLSSLGPSPSHSPSNDFSPTSSTHHSLSIHPDNSNIIPVPAGQSGEQLSTNQNGLLTEDLSASHDDLSVEDVPAIERAVQPGTVEGQGKGNRTIADTNTTTAIQLPPVQNNQSVPSSQPNISTSQQDKDNASTSQQQYKEMVSSSLSISSPEPTSLTASKEHSQRRVSPSGERAGLLDDQLSPTDSVLSDDVASVDDMEGVHDDRSTVASVDDMEGVHDDRSTVVGSDRNALVGNGSNAVVGDDRNTVVTTILNLLSTLNQHLSVDAESADLMYSLPASSDTMKGQITSSHVLAANINKMAVRGKDMSTWEPGAVSVVLLQQLCHMTSSMGGLLPQQLLEEDAPLLTSCEELSSHMTRQWSVVWPLLLEHVQLLSGCGRSLTELAATLTPALVAPGNPAHGEKACLQLLSILQGKVKISSPPGGNVEGRNSSSEASSPELSLREEAGNVEEERGEGAGKLEMATTVFGEDDNLSDHSSLISEGSAIAQIERELQEVVAGHGRQGSKGLPTTFLSPPLHLHPSHSDDGDDVSESLADSSPPHSSPGYIPTALEQRSSMLSSQASNQSSLRRRLGLLSESDSEGSGHDNSLHPPTTPLDNRQIYKPAEGGRSINSHSLREDMEQDDFDFYD